MSKHIKNIGVVSGVTMVSRVLGLLRDMLTTGVFGASALNSAFVTAFTLPNLFRRLLGEGALTAAFIPTLQEEWKRGDRAGAMGLVNRVASWVLVATGMIVLVAVLVILGFLWVIAERENASELVLRWQMAGMLAVVLFPYVIFVCLSAAFSAALQVCGRFLEPALSPVWLNLTMIGLLGWAVLFGGNGEGAEMTRMLWLCGGVLLGGVFQMMVPAGALLREGWKPKFDLKRDAGVRQIMRLMVPTLFGSAIYLINMAVSRFIGLSLNDAAATVLNLSTRLMELPIGVFAVAVTTVVFPLIARHAASGDLRSLAMDYRKGMRLILMVNVPAAVGLGVLALPIIRVLFQRGAFVAEDVLVMVPVLVISAAGLPVFAFVNLALRVFYAQKDTKTPVRAALLSFVVNVVASLALIARFSTSGLAFAGFLAVLTQAWFLQRHLVRRDAELGLRWLAGDGVKIFLASAVMGVAVGVLWFGAGSFWEMGRWVEVPVLLGVVGVGVGIYAGVLFLLKVEGREELVEMIRRKVRRQKAE